MSDKEQEHETPSSPLPEEEEAAPAVVAPVVKKTWGQPAVAPPSATENNGEKKSLLAIMAEEQEKEASDRAERQEAAQNVQLVQDDAEEQALQEALRASLLLEDDDPVMDEDTRLAIMLSTAEAEGAASPAAVAPAAAAAAMPESTGISAEELEAIEMALREADDEETARSFQLAMSLQNEETARGGASNKLQSMGSAQLKQGNVRTVSRAEYMREQEAAIQGDAPAQRAAGYADDDDYEEEAGFRLNSSKPSQWARLDQGSVIGPNNEVRTKHDLELQSQANAYRLSLDLEQDEPVHVGNKAFNSFKRSVQKTTNNKNGTNSGGHAGRAKHPPGTEKPQHVPAAAAVVPAAVVPAAVVPAPIVNVVDENEKSLTDEAEMVVESENAVGS